MGNFCKCNLDLRMNDIFESEFKAVPTNTSIMGLSIFEENFVIKNLEFHTTDFSSLIFQKNQRTTNNSSHANRKRESSNYSPLSFYRSIQERIKEEDEDENILKEGQLLKYRPGVSQEYTPRWCRLTVDGFAYYKTQWAATCSNTVPLAFVPIIQIKQARILKEPKPKKKTNKSLSKFEIFILGEDEIIEISRNTKGFTLKPNSSEPLPSSWWSIRQIEWFTAERRLLFAHEDLDTIKQWVDLINTSLKPCKF